MRHAWAGGALLLAISGSGHGALAAESETIDMETAVRRALAQRPTLTAVRARVGEARGRLTTAETWPLNPTFDGSAAARRQGANTGVDFEMGLSQQFQIGGQRAAQSQAAHAGVEVARGLVRRAQQAAATEVRMAFVACLERRALLGVTKRDYELTRELFELAQLRLERGAGTQLGSNAAATELARTETRMRRARAAYRTAAARLSEAIGADPLVELEVVGTSSAVRVPRVPLVERLAQAESRRDDLNAARARAKDAEARTDLARSRRWPNVGLRVFAGRENSSETLIGGGLSIPLPVFSRNQGGVQRAEAVVQRSHAEIAAARLRVRREVVAAVASQEAALRNAQTMRALVLGTLEPNLGLLRRAFDAGKATWSEVLLLRRTFMQAQRDLITSEAELARAGIQVQLASGTTPLPAGVVDGGAR